MLVRFFSVIPFKPEISVNLSNKYVDLRFFFIESRKIVFFISKFRTVNAC